MSDGKVMIVYLIAGLIKISSVILLYKKWTSIFQNVMNHLVEMLKLKLSNQATKEDISNISHIDTSSFALKTSLSSLKTKGDKVDIDKLVPVPVDLSTLSNVVKNVFENNVYDKLVVKVNSIDTSGFVLKTKYDTDKSELENKIPDTSDLVKMTDYNTKITEI